MGDLIELKTRIAQELKEHESPDFESFLVAEGLALLADFRSIEDAGVRASLLQMVSKIAAALRAGQDLPRV